jgi:hypothetical protein
MSVLSIQPTYPIFTDIDGQPLESGYIWIGTVNLNPITNPINVYWDAALTQPAAQPIRTVSGYPSNAGTPARLYVGADYSIQVQNKNATVVYSATDGASDRFSSAQISFIQAGSGAVSRTVQSKLRETISPVDFGAVGDGVTNDGPAIALAVAAADGKVLDLCGLTYLISTAVNVTLTKGIEVCNGKFLYNFSTPTEVGFRVTSPEDIYITNLFIDGQDTCAKLLVLRATGTEASAFVYGYHGKNAFQTLGTTGLASILQCGPFSSGTDEFESVHVVNCRIENADSSDSANGVGRGILIDDAYESLVTNCYFENIGPYGDGDGIFCITSNNELEKSFVISNCTFKNCHKRSIKSQAVRTFVSNVVCYRTINYTPTGGQTEISLQDGGVVDGVSLYYADDCFPKSTGLVDCIVRKPDTTFEARNISVFCEEPDNVIRSIVFFAQDGVVMKQPIVENVTFNSYVDYFVTTTGEGVSGFGKSDFVIQDAVFRNINGRGFNPSPGTDPTSGQLYQGFVLCLRSATEYIQMQYSAFDIRIGSDNSVQSAYLDTAAGNLVFLQAQLTKYSDCVGFDTTTYNGTGVGTFNTDRVVEYISTQHILYKKLFVNEGATSSTTFRIDQDTMCKIMVMYAGSAGANRKLYTEGFAGSTGGTDSEYFETVAGNKSNAVPGAISITANAGTNTITVAKTAGSGSSGGFLMIIIQHIRNVNEV